MGDCRRRVVYPPAGAVLLVAMGLLIGVGGQSADAQTHSPVDSSTTTTQWRLVLDGEPVDWPGQPPNGSLDSLRAVGQHLLTRLQAEGHYYATLDSATVDTSARSPSVQMFAHRGPKVRIGRLRITGVHAVPKEEVRALVDTEKGDLLRVGRLEADIQAILDRYERAGYPLAHVRVSETRLERPAESPILQVTLQVKEGPALWLRRIEVPDDARTTPELLAHLAGVDVGAPLRDYDPETLRRRLQKHDFFQEVGEPRLRIADDGGAVLRVPVEEAAPGAFDVVLGYLPPSQARDGGQLVGRGHLLLEHLFGGGRTAEFTLDRRPGQSSIFDVALSDPYLFGLPLRLEGQFRGEQRDSTYGERTYELGAGYRLGNGLEITASLSREVVRPGPAGRRLLEGRQRIPRSTTLFYGVGLRIQSVDRRKNPREGVSFDVRVSQGRKQRRLRRVTAGNDTTHTADAFRQERLRARVRGYIPLFDRQVLAVGGEGALLLSRDYDRSDLFRLGGATSLRGYDEDRFLGNVVARGLLEYRLQLDPESYAFAFADLGYVSRPALRAAPATAGWHPGYGVGIRLQTAIGRIATTYALNPDIARPSNGRIHLGLSVGL